MNDQAISTIEAPSVLGSLAAHYGMDRRAFEETVKATIMPQGATREQTAAFLLVAKAHDLSPFTREIFAFPSKGGIQAVVSVDGWMKLINSHPMHNGMVFEDDLNADGQIVSITCRIHRKDREHPVEVTEYMAECRRDTDTWKRWPARMLRHKAAIQAARYAFGFAGIMEPDEAERAQEVETVPAQLISDDRKERHDSAVEQYGDAIAKIKERIAAWDSDQDADHLYTVREIWEEIPQRAQMDLWVAPSKGGVFTTHERKVIHEHLPQARD